MHTIGDMACGTCFPGFVFLADALYIMSVEFVGKHFCMSCQFLLKVLRHAVVAPGGWYCNFISNAVDPHMVHTTSELNGI